MLKHVWKWERDVKGNFNVTAYEDFLYMVCASNFVATTYGCNGQVFTNLK